MMKELITINCMTHMRRYLFWKNRIDLLNKKIDEFILIIEKTKISLQEEETDSKNIMDSFLETNGSIRM